MNTEFGIDGRLYVVAGNSGDGRKLSESSGFEHINGPVFRARGGI